METGTIDMKKREMWLITFTYVVTYLFRCNTDITSSVATAQLGIFAILVNKICKIMNIFVWLDHLKS